MTLQDFRGETTKDRLQELKLIIKKRLKNGGNRLRKWIKIDSFPVEDFDDLLVL